MEGHALVRRHIFRKTERRRMLGWLAPRMLGTKIEHDEARYRTALFTAVIDVRYALGFHVGV